MKPYCLAIVPLLTSCTFIPRATIELGYIDWNLGISDEINTRGDPHPMNGTDTSIRLEADVLEVGPFVVDLGIGPHIVTSNDYSGEVYGGMISNRVRWRATDWLEPYLVQAHSMDYFEHTWATEQVKYGFTTQFGAGVRIVFTEKISMNIDWR